MPKRATPAKLDRRRVLLVDDHPILREGMAECINREPDLMVCGEATEGKQTLAAIQRCQPDVVVLDISLADTHGLEVLKDIQAQHPKLPVIMFSMHDESLYAERALHAGARGYVMKKEPPDVLLQALRQVLKGELFVSRDATKRILDRMTGHRTTAASPLDVLSDRECEVLHLIGQGFGTSEIALRLHISAKTVSSHREKIKQKLQLPDGQALLRQAIHVANG